MKAALLLCALLASGNPYEGKPDAVRAGAHAILTENVKHFPARQSPLRPTASKH